MSGRGLYSRHEASLVCFGFAAGCVTLGVVYALIELAGGDTQTQAIVISRADFGGLAKLQSTLSKLAVEA